MKLYFVRHGRANHAAASDEKRALSDEGNADMKKMATILANLGIKPKRLFSSPRLRAKETAQYIGDAVKVKPKVDAACDFNFDVDAVAELAKGLSDSSGIMFVGHNPSISAVVEALCGAQVDLPAGAVVCIDRVKPPTVASANLEWILTPDVVNSILTD